MRVLIIGVTGLLGSNVVTRSVNAGHYVSGTYHTTEPELSVQCRQLDIRERDVFLALVENAEPDVVLNCAAMTDVDECEAKPDRANEINGRAPGEMANICDERDIEFVHFSTDYVFDGENESKYGEDADPAPIQAYGRSKLVGEQRVREHHSAPLIVRLSFVYGMDRISGELEGFPAWVVSRLNAGEDVPLFVDQHVTPSRAGQVAETVLELVADGADGTYHIACRECLSPYQFGEEICRQVGVDDSALTPSAMANVSRSASRPAHTCFSVDRVEKELGRPQPALNDDLGAIRDALEVVVR